MMLVLFFLILELRMSLTPEQQSLTSPFLPLFHFMNDDFTSISPWMQYFPDEFTGLVTFGGIHTHQHFPAALACSCTCQGHRNLLINRSVVQESRLPIIWWGTQTLYFYKPSEKKVSQKESWELQICQLYYLCDLEQNTHFGSWFCNLWNVNNISPNCCVNQVSSTQYLAWSW